MPKTTKARQIAVVPETRELPWQSNADVWASRSVEATLMSGRGGITVSIEQVEGQSSIIVLLSGEVISETFTGIHDMERAAGFNVPDAATADAFGRALIAAAQCAKRVGIGG